ncbi:AraC family transcriptional regulator [Methylomonas sp. AM2-LC]|uniref:helix-turn-helix transcriptional regulator n=1 Tax=Methylomonas sp. AM2-LC TaxID=3153301 RepID=UPI003264ED66
MISKQFFAKRWSIDSEDLHFLPQTDCLHQSLPKELGNGRSAIFQLEDGLRYIETLYTPNRDLAVLSRIDYQEPQLIMTISLKGQSIFTSKAGNELIFKQGYTTLVPVNTDSIGERHYEANITTQQLRFALSKNWLEKYFGETQTRQLLSQKHERLQPTGIQALVRAQQLLDRNIFSSSNRLLMHGQALSLLAFELSCLIDNKPKNVMQTHQKDSIMARSARDILYDEFKQPPSVEQLAKRVGTNAFKLKKLFHRYFNNTPYGLLLEIRMNKAYQLLISEQCQVSVAANKVGYNHASNFSTAFTKFFGQSPKAITKKG